MGKLENHLQKLLSKEERSWPRRKCNYFTDCHDSGGNRLNCRVIDISYRGLGVVVNSALRKGDMVKIADPRVKAEVVWTAEGRAGLRVCN